VSQAEILLPQASGSTVKKLPIIESEVGWNREIIVPISMQMLYRYRDFLLAKLKGATK